ncbi:hypothetical protein BKG93_00125 [Rodentibacter ratti]|uniref:Uncharacterized protein n=1 Tax=Rodentibacter ratti TaxID=1906745 RepID=A0A1V3LCM7_9PAST|nr:hypothetical protein [Rodentibacter ratti]OOF88046.1 hypothetical protein BKG93_00125 [Rodentibacter ratti]
MELLPLIVFVLTWFMVAKFYSKKGYGAIIRHLAGFSVGLIGLIATVLIVMPKAETPQQTDSKQEQHLQDIKAENTQDEKHDNQNQVEAIATKTKIAEEVKVQEMSKEDVKQVQTLGLELKKFSTRIDKALKNAQSPFKMEKNPKVTEGEVNDVANYMFSDNFGVIITLDKKTHKVKSIMTIVTPSPNNSDENLVMLFSNAAVLSAFEGENEIKVLGKKIMELTMSAMTEYDKTKKDTSKKMIWNGKKYGLLASGQKVRSKSRLFFHCPLA